MASSRPEAFLATTPAAATPSYDGDGDDDDDDYDEGIAVAGDDDDDGDDGDGDDGDSTSSVAGGIGWAVRGLFRRGRLIKTLGKAMPGQLPTRTVAKGVDQLSKMKDFYDVSSAAAEDTAKHRAAGWRVRVLKAAPVAVGHFVKSTVLGSVLFESFTTARNTLPSLSSLASARFFSSSGGGGGGGSSDDGGDHGDDVNVKHGAGNQLNGATTSVASSKRKDPWAEVGGRWFGPRHVIPH